MRVERIEDDIWIFHGDFYESVATVFVHRGKALLIDALGSDADAQWMQAYIEGNLLAAVKMIVMTHYMSDHMAGLRLFPGAQILAHRDYLYTYLSQRHRTQDDDASYVAPTATYSQELNFTWGAREIRLFHNPGKTFCATAIDVPRCDLVFCGDALVGNIAYIGSSAPSLIDNGLAILERLHRGRIVPGHIGVLGGGAFSHARIYLKRLGDRVRACRDADAIANIQIEECLAPGVQPVPFEVEWHGRNLGVIAERRVFSVGHDASRVAAVYA
ncbi:MBL fold metallo-hydrolase [Pinirhizobacter soli]|uniref:MBL fold metallo-hydrolase n=1 Tax=Pinirhizobacter soli TaxID=2786953 RepID=UPI00202A46F7|nr:MBL fold metallo-hydrolase [Pinirhizobacter soli]